MFTRTNVTGRSGCVKGLKNAAVGSYFENGTKYIHIHIVNTKLLMRKFHVKKFM